MALGPMLDVAHLLDWPLRPTLWIWLCLLLFLTGCSGWTWDLTDCFASLRTAGGPCCGRPWSLAWLHSWSSPALVCP